MPGGRVPGPVGDARGAGLLVSSAAPLGSAGSGSRTLVEFKQAVLEGQMARSRARGRVHAPPVPAAELSVVEGNHKLRLEAAEACRRLLADARAALASAKAAGEPAAAPTTSIGVASAYRDYAQDEAAWNASFHKHYHKTQTQRSGLPGGAHGDAAVRWLIEHLAPIKAPPGFSNHSNGLAVDFSTVHGGTTYGPNTDQREGWRRTWLHPWLVANAARFKFMPLASEEWHWDYR